MYSTWLKACTQNTRVRIESSKVSEEAMKTSSLKNECDDQELIFISPKTDTENVWVRHRQSQKHVIDLKSLQL